MYERTLRICFAGCEERARRVIRGMAPLPHFRHVFEDIPAPGAEAGGADAASRADLVLAGPGWPEGALDSLLAACGKDTQTILLQAPHTPLAPELLGRLADVWRLPLADDELRFHFRRWQEGAKQAADLAEQRQFLEVLMDTSPNLIWFKDKNGIHELVNASFCRTVGKERSDVQGRGHAYIWNVEQDDPACIESERLVMESGQTQLSEEAITTGAGTRLLTVYKSPLRNCDGSMMGTMGIAVDVTQERLYRKRILKNNAELEAIFASMDCGIVRHTLDGSRVLSVNQAALRLLGYESEEDLQTGFQMVAASVVEEDARRLREMFHQLQNAGDSASYEYRVRHPDGSMWHIMGNARLVEQEGALVCQRFLLDCTAQKESQEREQSEKDRRQMELVRALCADYQAVGVIADGQRGAILQLRHEPDAKLADVFAGDAPLAQKLATYAERCVHPEDRNTCAEAFSVEALRARLAREGTCYFTFRALDGNDVRYFQLKAVRVGEPGNGGAIVIGLQSVDERIRREMESRDHLGEALKQATQASQAKTVFLSNMSHDIRTPMNAVLGYASLAMSRADDPAHVRGYLSKILDSGNHLISLINDILDMSHIESGKIQLEEQLSSLPAILRELWNILEPAAASKQQTLELAFENVTHEDVYCDRLRLKQILLNLIGNALKYTQAGGRISVTVTELPCFLAERASTEIRIADNGIGMTADFLERIFEPFERARTSDTATIQGTGLGMAITKNLVDMMQGGIQVESEPGKGTTFTVRLNFRIPPAEEEGLAPGASFCGPLPGQGAADGDAAQGTQGAGETAQGCECAGRGARILLAEDNEMNQEIAREFLTDAGYEVDVAANGQEAVDMVAAGGPGHYAVVLMDVQMPVMNGYQATERIRALPDAALASIPIIAMTANSFEEDRQEALNRGMNGHVAKPIDFGALFKTLRAFH